MNWSIEFLEPWWLALLAVLPLIAWQSMRSLAALGRFRRPLAILLRCSVLTMLAAALADLQFVRHSNRLCTLFVLDQSQSIPSGKSGTERSLELVADAIRNRSEEEDLSGLIVFGATARIELPPMQYPRDHEIRSIGSLIDSEHSDVAAGIKLALGSFPPDCSKRIVLISDGNANRGNALAQAVAARENSVPIDVVPIEYRYDREILVDKVVVPPDLKKGDTANLKIVIRSGHPAQGIVRLNQIANQSSREVLRKPIALREGLNVFTVTQTIDHPDFYTYEAHFEPDAQAGDRVARNNQASSFTWIRGEGRVLLIAPSIGSHRALVAKLQQDNIQIVERTPDSLAGSLAEFRQYDSVVIANVPAEQLDEKVQQAIVANTHELGAGLVMIGGPDSFGAGGYNGSPIEKALPVDMEIKSTKVRGKGALVLIMHACEIPEGNFWQKKIAQLSIEKLSSRDDCGLLYWGGQVSWLFALRAVGNGRTMLRRIQGMAPGDMPDFDPAMRDALKALQKNTAMVKHVIIISDGDPQPPTNAVLQGFKKSKITCTTVAVASHGGFEKRLMKSIAMQTGGRYYEVANPKTLPQIYTKETRVVSKPLIFERKNEPWEPRLSLLTEPVAGLPASLPPIVGFVLTTPKPTARIAITSPLPADGSVNPILAHWQYGLGKAVAFTSDTGEQWAVGWPETELFGKFWSQVVRWSMRSTDSGNLSVHTQTKDGKVIVVVNALDKSSEYMNFLRLQGKMIAPDMNTVDLEFSQTEPGKYVAEFEASQSGSYFVRMGYRQPDGQAGLVSTGINIPYPPEYRDLVSNRELLENVSSITSGNGGRVVEWDRADEVDFFSHDQPPSFRLQDAWPLMLLIALCTFLFDVGVRRIAVDPLDVTLKLKQGWAWLRRRQLEAPASATMERLRSKKVEVGEQFQKQRRFEIPADQQPAESVIETSQQPTAPSRATLGSAEKPSELTPQQDVEPQSYTSRLLKAKKDVWQQRTDDEKGSTDDG